MNLKTLRFVLVIFLLVGMFGVAITDCFIPGSNWKTIALGVLYGCANIIIFVFK